MLITGRSRLAAPLSNPVNVVDIEKEGLLTVLLLFSFASGARPIQRGADQTAEERVRAVRAAFELRVVLDAHEEGQIVQLHGLYQVPAGRHAREREPRPRELLPIIVVEFIAVAVALLNKRLPVTAVHRRPHHDLAGIGAQAQRAALVNPVTLARHEVDNLVFAELIELPGICT